MMPVNGEIDDLVIKVLGHTERKRILRIVSSYPEGIKYTGILGETGLTTGRLNYHLGELDGFLERDEERQYTLTKLGEKAVATLEFIKQDVDPIVYESVNTKRNQRLMKMRKRFDIGFYFLAFVMIDLVAFFTYISFKQRDPVFQTFTILSIVFTAGILYLANRSRKQDPDKVVWIWEWLEWKLFKGYDEN